MTLRDQFAIHAPDLYSRRQRIERTERVVVDAPDLGPTHKRWGTKTTVEPELACRTRLAYEWADAMLQARKAKQ